jgi:tannase
MRMASLQIIHLFSAIVEMTNKYYPPSCEMTRITTDVIQAYDHLDGWADGVVSRTDLCMLSHNATNVVGKAYLCPASADGGFGPPGGGGFGRPGEDSSSAASGTVSVQVAAVANNIWQGLFDSKGRLAYVSFRPTADFSDAGTTYSTDTGKYGASVSGIGVQWVQYFLNEVASPTLSLNNATYDTVRAWILEGMQKYSDTLQTNWPDLADFRDAGGKIIHYQYVAAVPSPVSTLTSHGSSGESDPAIPSGSSVIYHEAVRKTMYPDLSYNESFAKLNEWYRFYLFPGAGHCGASRDQPNGPFPNNVLGSLIDWYDFWSSFHAFRITVTGTTPKRITMAPNPFFYRSKSKLDGKDLLTKLDRVEKKINPVLLNATVTGGNISDVNQKLCTWPLRPRWVNNGTTMECVSPSDDALATWPTNFPSIPVPVS